MERVCKRLLFFVLMLGVFFLSQTVFAEEKTEQKNQLKTEQKTEEQTEQKDQKKIEQKKDQKSSHKLEEITVSGKRVTEPVTSPYAVAESSALQTEVITKEEIEALHPQTLWDVIEQFPGMQVTYQGRQHIDFSNMRGTGSYGVILDGVYVSQLDRIFATLPVDAIESMTIVRDATALTLGPLTNFGSGTGSSNQGFVVIKTKRASKLEGGFVGSYGTFHTEKEHLYQGAKIGNFDYRIAATHNSTTGRADWYNGSANRSLLFRGGYTLPTFEADVLYYTSRGTREFQRGEILMPTGNNWSKVGTLDNSKWKIDPLLSDMIAVNLSKRWSDTQTTTLSYAYNNIKVTSVTGSFINSSVSQTDQNSRGQSASLRHVINSHNNVLKVGGQFLEYVCPTGLAPSTGKRTDEKMYSLFAQDEYHLFNDKLTIDGGIRADKKQYDNSPVTGEPLDEWAKETFTYTIGTSYKLGPIITLTGRYAYSENSLSSYQVNPTGGILPPERRSRYEGGILANIHPAFNPFLTLYYYDTKNQKVSTTGKDPTTGKTVSSYIDPATGDEINFVTTDDVRTKGAEIGISGQIFKPFTYYLQYSFTETDNHETNLTIPRHTASARFNYRFNEHLSTNLSLRYVSTCGRSSSPMGVIYYKLGDYTRLDANITYNTKIFNRDTQITVYGRNLGDKAYATRYVTGAYFDPGRTYGMQLSYSFF